MQRIKGSTFLLVFCSYIKIINLVKRDFLNTILKNQMVSQNTYNFLINYRGRKLENCYLIMEEKI